jgi:hypothetical protein
MSVVEADSILKSSDGIQPHEWMAEMLPHHCPPQQTNHRSRIIIDVLVRARSYSMYLYVVGVEP